MELQVSEAMYVNAGGDAKLEGAAKTRSIKIYPMFEGPYEVEIPLGVGGHGGGDTGIILALQRWLDGDRSNPSICTLEQTARNHLIAYAAEESRLQGKVVDMNEYEARLGGLTKEGEPK